MLWTSVRWKTLRWPPVRSAPSVATLVGLRALLGLLALALVACDWVPADRKSEPADSQARILPPGEGKSDGKAAQGAPADAKGAAAETAGAAVKAKGAAAEAKGAAAERSVLAPSTFADLAEQSDPAVVFVHTITQVRRGYRRVLAGGSGSGFVFAEDGKILTNYHVVQGAHAIEVELSDGRSFPAKVMGADPHTDVAVLKVDALGLRYLSLGDSDALRVGDWVLAIGNPFGLEHTATAGIISAKERSGDDVRLDNPGAYYSFLQTDASINQGNSGGPLIDLRGHVVGMNTAINPEANSIGFAIPSKMLSELVPRLLKEGVVQRAAIGVSLADLRHGDRAQLGVGQIPGSYVVSVSQRGPAALGGVLAGDYITSFGGSPIKNSAELRWSASLAQVGRPVEMGLIRAGKELRVSVVPLPLRTR